MRLSLEIDPNRVSFDKLSELKAFFERAQAYGGGYEKWLKLVNDALDNHPDNPARKFHLKKRHAR